MLFPASNRSKSRPDPLTDDEEALRLVSEIYASILSPERFKEVLELWDRNITNGGEKSDRLLKLLDHQLTNAIPLLEASLREVVNKDELVTRIKEYDRPSILISPNHIVVGSNQSGRACFNLYDGDKIDLELQSVLARDQLSKVFRQALEVSDDDTFQVVNFSSSSPTGRTLENLSAVRTIRISTTKQGFVLVSTLDLVLSDVGARAFQTAFGLTDAEMQIVTGLISGKRQTDIAEHQGVREDTIKKHIRSIRDKTRTPNTISLICLTASFAQISAEHGKQFHPSKSNKTIVTNASKQTYNSPTQHKLAKVKGSTVEYVDFGRPGGEPLIILHSSMVGFILPPEFINGLIDQGYRVIIPFRPGTGVSSPLKEPFSLDRMSRFLIEFADSLKLQQFALVGGTIGFAYAATIAAMVPDRVTGLVGIAGYLPIDPKTLYKSMARYQRGVLFTLQKNRALAKFLVLSGYKMFLQLGAHGFMSQMMSSSKADLQVIDDGNSLGALGVGLRIAGAQGVDALLDDAFLVLFDWKDKIAQLNRPVLLLHGDDDGVFKLEVIREFCAKNPNFKLTELHKAGQLMIYANPMKLAQLVGAGLKETRMIPQAQIAKRSSIK